MRTDSFMQQYDRLLGDLDSWFRSFQTIHAEQMKCGKGCAGCCYGLFDVALPDTLSVVDGIDPLPEEHKLLAMDRALAIHAQILQVSPELEAPYFLSDLSEEQIDHIVERLGDIGCPLLDEKNNCLIYEFRPLACRLEGVPIVDKQDDLFGDWCELNFVEGLPSELKDELRLDYYRIREIESGATEHLSKLILGKRKEDVTIFIPSVIASAEFFRNLHLLK